MFFYFLFTFYLLKYSLGISVVPGRCRQCSQPHLWSTTLLPSLVTSHSPSSSLTPPALLSASSPSTATLRMRMTGSSLLPGEQPVSCPLNEPELDVICWNVSFPPAALERARGPTWSAVWPSMTPMTLTRPPAAPWAQRPPFCPPPSPWPSSCHLCTRSQGRAQPTKLQPRQVGEDPRVVFKTCSQGLSSFKKKDLWYKCVYMKCWFFILHNKWQYTYNLTVCCAA